MSKFVLQSMTMLPGAKINRMEFLESNFRRYGQTQRMESESPISVYGSELVDRVAKSVIKAHTFRTTIESTACGIPGGFAMIGTIPADLAQMNFHIIVLAQKLAYLYGWDSLFGKNGETDDETYEKLSLFVGVMYGVGVAENAVKEISKSYAGHLVKKLPKLSLTKYLIYRAVKAVAKELGKQVTKESFAKAMGKIVPFVGGAISGTMTYVTFKPMAKRLQKSLSERCCLAA